MPTAKRSRLRGANNSKKTIKFVTALVFGVVAGLPGALAAEPSDIEKKQCMETCQTRHVQDETSCVRRVVEEHYCRIPAAGEPSTWFCGNAWRECHDHAWHYLKACERRC